jgi:hypothetical protein
MAEEGKGRGGGREEKDRRRRGRRRGRSRDRKKWSVRKTQVTKEKMILSSNPTSWQHYENMREERVQEGWGRRRRKERRSWRGSRMGRGARRFREKEDKIKEDGEEEGEVEEQVRGAKGVE